MPLSVRAKRKTPPWTPIPRTDLTARGEQLRGYACTGAGGGGILPLLLRCCGTSDTPACARTACCEPGVSRTQEDLLLPSTCCALFVSQLHASHQAADPIVSLMKLRHPTVPIVCWGESSMGAALRRSHAGHTCHTCSGAPTPVCHPCTTGDSTRADLTSIKGCHIVLVSKSLSFLSPASMNITLSLAPIHCTPLPFFYKSGLGPSRGYSTAGGCSAHARGQGGQARHTAENIQATCTSSEAGG